MAATSTIAPPDSPEVRKYNRIRRWLGIIEFLLGLALLLLAYASAFQSYTLAVFLYVGLLVLISEVLGLGLDYYSFYLEHRYQLSNQKLRAWVWDETKGLLVTAVLAAALVEIGRAH